MREMEEVHRQREAEKAASLQQRLSRLVASLPPPASADARRAVLGLLTLLWIRLKEQEFVF